MWRKKKKKGLILNFVKYFDRLLIWFILLMVIWVCWLKFYWEFQKNNSAKKDLLSQIWKEKTQNKDETNIKDEDIFSSQKYNFANLRVNLTQEEDIKNNGYSINWYFLNEKPETIEVLTCAKNHLKTYDREWYKLNYSWKDKFKFNVRYNFNNICNIPYKFKFTAWNNEKIVDFSLKETLKEKKALGSYEKVMNNLKIILKENWYKQVKNGIYWELSYYECYGLLDIEGLSTNVCEWIKSDYSSVGFWLISKWKWVYEIKVAELWMSPNPVLNYYYIEWTWEKIKKDNLNVIWDYLVWEKYVFDLVNKKALSESKTTNLRDFFYDKNSWKITSFNWKENYKISWVNLEKWFVMKNWYFVMLEWTDRYFSYWNKEKLKIYYGKSYPWLSEINVKSFEVWNTRLWALQKPSFNYFEINEDNLKITWDGFFGLDSVNFDLKNEKIIKYETNKYKR